MTWLGVPGYEGFYSVSDSGQVRSDTRYVEHVNGPKLVKERILKQADDRYGYKVVVLQRDGRAKTFKVHRLVLLAFNGPSKLTVNHKNMRKHDNTLENLEYVTVAANLAHAVVNGPPKKMRRGSRHPGYKITPEMWDEIRALRKARTPVVVIGQRFGIHPHTVYKDRR